jgi:tetratricopeptide (TPR) repeat protein
MVHRYRESLEALGPLPFSANTAGPAAAPPNRSGEPQAGAIPTQAWLVRGLDCLELNQLSDAVISLRRALALDEASGTARMGLGDALARSGDLEAAADTYRQQLRAAPATVDAWYKLGSVYQELSQKLGAEFAHQRAGHVLALQLSAERDVAHGNYWGAAQALLPLAQSQSSSSTEGPEHGHEADFQPGLHALFATALLQLGYPSAAEREFKAEMSRDPASFPAQLGLAEIEGIHADWQSALMTFHELTIRYPRQLSLELESPPPSLLFKAWHQAAPALPGQILDAPAGKLWSAWLEGNGLDSPRLPEYAGTQCAAPPPERAPGYWMTEACFAQLRRQLGAARNLGSNDRAKLAEAEYRLGDYEAAVQVGRQLNQSRSDEPWGEYWLVKSYSALEEQCFERLAEISPDSARVHEMLARYHSERQQLTAARSEYEAALRLAPDLPDLHLGLGTVDWQAGDWDKAQGELEKALQSSPGSRVAAYELGDCLTQKHEWQRAETYLELAAADPAVGRQALLDLAKAESELGDSDAAIKHLTSLAPGDRDGEVHYRLAMIYRKLGDLTRAQQAIAQSETLRRTSDKSAQDQIEALEREGGGEAGSQPK